jgi:hypothetical protein
MSVCPRHAGDARHQGGVSVTTCPKCNYTRQPSDTAPDYECPACRIVYAKFTAGNAPKIVGTTRKVAPRAASGAGAAAANPSAIATLFMATALAATLGVTFYVLATDETFSPSRDLSAAAFVQCKERVGDRLSAPKTADFPLLDFKAWDMGGGTYVIKSHVDSQNGFGAMLRTNWHCKIQHRGGSSSDPANWRVLEIELMSR